MGIVITHNMTAAFASRQHGIVSTDAAKTSEKLSSGYRINRSADDAAGLTISEKMRAQIRGLNKASDNIQDGISLLQVAEGALNETHSILQRMRELAVQGANDTNTQLDREAVQRELEQLTEEVDRIADSTSYNSEIYPLKELSLENLNGKIGLSFANLQTLRATNNLGQFAYVNGKGQTLIDIKFNLNLEQNIIQILAVDGTILYEGDSYEAVYGGLQQEYNIGDWRYQPRQIGVSQYLNGNTFSFGFWNREKVSYDDVVSWLDSKSFTYWVSSDNSLVHVSTNNVQKADEASLETGNLWIQMGAKANQGMYLDLVDATANGIGLTNISVSDHDKAGSSISIIDGAISKVSEYRSNFGAQQNRLEHALAIADNTAENTQAAESRIRDADMAEEMVKMSKHNILLQAGQSMLAQANQSNQYVLGLLQ